MLSLFFLGNRFHNNFAEDLSIILHENVTTYLLFHAHSTGVIWSTLHEILVFEPVDMPQ